MNGQNILLEPGAQFGSYRIVSEIGRGNNGVVYLARQEPLDREVALKVLLPELSGNREYIDILMNEARYAARLCHPNIVQALDAGSFDGLYFLAMEYVHGRTLEEIRLDSPEILSLEFLIDLSIQLADAMSYAWENFQMTHGDIKPENLLICDDGKTLKLADLGLANVNGHAGDEVDSIMATPMYVAPELISSEGTRSVLSDIYSFGVMFYELIAGKPPFRGNTDHLLRCHLEAPVPPLLTVNPDVPVELAEFTHRMLEKSPQNRPGSWAEVRAFLEDFRDRRNNAGKQPAQPEAKPAPKVLSARLWLWIVFALLALVIVGTLAVMIWLMFLSHA
jgi:serine/threonine-protein kinase